VEWHPFALDAAVAQRQVIERLTTLEIWIDCFRPFDVKYGCQHARLQGLLDVIDSATDADAALRSGWAVAVGGSR
jgi:hypothetical protein